MSKGKIFLVGEEHSLTEMVETAYPTEKELQNFLEQHWDLLPGDQIDPDNPRRWLLVKSEMGGPDGEEESGQWSLDHLFLDQDGIPTFVECKLASNPEARRKVVAQMLDYAANGTQYWGAGKLRQVAHDTASKRSKKYLLDDKVRELRDGTPVVMPDKRDEHDPVVEDYWRAVESNLRSGRVRLVFVTGEAPRELRRLAEFLNSKMSDVKCFVVQIKQFCREGQNHKALVPSVVVRPPVSQEAADPLNRKTFLGKCKPEAREFFEKVLDDAESQRRSINWNPQSFYVRMQLADGRHAASIAFGEPPDTFGFCLSDLQAGLRLSQEQSARLMDELKGSRVFTRIGEKTLKAQVNRETAAQLQRTWRVILDRVDSLVAQQGATPIQSNQKVASVAT
jgi:hypothetical protein